MTDRTVPTERPVCAHCGSAYRPSSFGRDCACPNCGRALRGKVAATKRRSYAWIVPVVAGVFLIGALVRLAAARVQQRLQTSIAPALGPERVELPPHFGERLEEKIRRVTEDLKLAPGHPVLLARLAETSLYLAVLHRGSDARLSERWRRRAAGYAARLRENAPELSAQLEIDINEPERLVWSGNSTSTLATSMWSSRGFGTPFGRGPLPRGADDLRPVTPQPVPLFRPRGMFPSEGYGVDLPGGIPRPLPEMGFMRPGLAPAGGGPFGPGNGPPSTMPEIAPGPGSVPGMDPSMWPGMAPGSGPGAAMGPVSAPRGAAAGAPAGPAHPGAAPPSAGSPPPSADAGGGPPGLPPGPLSAMISAGSAPGIPGNGPGGAPGEGGAPPVPSMSLPSRTPRNPSRDFERERSDTELRRLRGLLATTPADPLLLDSLGSELIARGELESRRIADDRDRSDELRRQYLREAAEMYQAAAGRARLRLYRAAFYRASADIYARQRDWESQYRMLRRAADSAPFSPDVWRELQYACLRTQRPREARLARIRLREWSFPGLRPR